MFMQRSNKGLHACAIACLLGMVGCTADARDEGRPETRSVSLPEKCAVHRVEYDLEKDWDPVTETYPRNEAWENCMGVGRK